MRARVGNAMVDVIVRQMRRIAVSEEGELQHAHAGIAAERTKGLVGGVALVGQAEWEHLPHRKASCRQKIDPLPRFCAKGALGVIAPEGGDMYQHTAFTFYQ